MTRRASLYCRISRDREGAGLGVGTQEDDCRELAASLGLTVVSVHTDNDVSAYSGKSRPGYKALLAEIRDGDVDVVIAWHTDRLHRSPVELEDYVTACEKGGVVTQTVKAGHIDLSTASGLMIARMLGATARYEVDHGVERMRRAKRRAAEAGQWRGGRRPYGYEADGVTVRPAEASAISEATIALLAGSSIRGLIADWNEQGRRTTMGNAWASNSFRTTMLRARNAGLLEQHGQIIGKAQWPAIVPEEQWRALVSMLSSPARRTNVSNTARRWLGSGLYLCECGRPLVCSSVNGTASYRCRTGCGQLSRRQEEVDNVVKRWMVERLSRPDAKSLMPRRGHVTGAKLAENNDQAVTLRARLNRMAVLCAKGQIDDWQLTEATKEINAELATIQSEIESYYSGTEWAGIANAPFPDQAWLRAPLRAQRAVLYDIATVKVLRGGHGRPAGWVPGDSYFRPELVQIEGKRRD